MKFLMFNLAVVAALAYLVLGHGADMSPLLAKARATAAQVHDDVVTAAKMDDVQVEYAKPAVDPLGDRMAGVEDAVTALQARLDATLARMDVLSSAKPVKAAAMATEQPSSVAAPHPLLQDLAQPVVEIPEDVAMVSSHEREVSLGALVEDMEMLYARKMGE